MEFEYWWLLGFPLFFGLGWLAKLTGFFANGRRASAAPP